MNLKVFADLDCYRHIIGLLLKDYNNRIKYQGRFNREDFVIKEVEYIVLDFLVNPEYGCRIKDLNVIMLSSALQNTEFFPEKSTEPMLQNGGIRFLQQCVDTVSESDDIEYYFQKLKKLSFLKEIANMGLDVSDFIDVSDQEGNMIKKGEQAERLENATLDELVAQYNDVYAKVENKFTIASSSEQESEISSGIMELLTKFTEEPDVGAPLCGKTFNYITRGARLGKLYLRSASSGTGKSRLSIFDACEIAFPEGWRHDANDDKGFNGQGFYEEYQHGVLRPPRKVLFITTETSRDEVRPTILAKISGLNEGDILSGKIMKGDSGEEDRKRLLHAVSILEKYKNNFFLEQIENPDQTNVEAMIRKYVRRYGVQYVFFDYIFSSSNLIAEVNNSKLREDVILGMLADKLKSLAVQYNIFIMTSTQLSAEGMGKPGFKSEICLRGAKSLADKVDVGAIISRPIGSDSKELESFYSEMPFAGIDRQQVMDIYKNRSGSESYVRIPYKINLGTGERVDGPMLSEDNLMREITASTEYVKNILDLSYVKNTSWE